MCGCSVGGTLCSANLWSGKGWTHARGVARWIGDQAAGGEFLFVPAPSALSGLASNPLSANPLSANPIPPTVVCDWKPLKPSG